LNTELSAKNKIHAIGTAVIPVLRYSFGIINWNQEEIQKLDRKTRKMLTVHGQHHPRAGTDLLYVPSKGGGRGLMQIEGTYIAEVTKLMECVERKEDLLRTHQRHTNSTLLKQLRILRNILKVKQSK